ncbi:hypothetical protein GF351_06340 [Candidatus Woesearchaeota archaeon]|nr:hypothetical protein [Candidatus Woesearchaeota archaeon]
MGDKGTGNDEHSIEHAVERLFWAGGMKTRSIPEEVPVRRLADIFDDSEFTFSARLSDIRIEKPHNLREDALNETTFQLSMIEKQLNSYFSSRAEGHSLRDFRSSQEGVDISLALAATTVYHAELLFSSSETAGRLRESFYGRLRPVLMNELKSLQHSRAKRKTIGENLTRWISSKRRKYLMTDIAINHYELGCSELEEGTARNRQDLLLKAQQNFRKALEMRFRPNQYEYKHLMICSMTIYKQFRRIEDSHEVIRHFEKSHKRPGDYADMLQIFSYMAEDCLPEDTGNVAEQAKICTVELQERISEEQHSSRKRYRPEISFYIHVLHKIADNLAARDMETGDDFRQFCRNLDFYAKARKDTDTA